jgi:hypothetical protein
VPDSKDFVGGIHGGSELFLLPPGRKQLLTPRGTFGRPKRPIDRGGLCSDSRQFHEPGQPPLVYLDGKFIILRAGAGAELWILAVILAVNGTISIFYYLKIISAMFRGFAEPMAGSGVLTAARVPLIAAFALALLALTVVVLGVYPSLLLSFIGTFTTAGL